MGIPAFYRYLVEKYPLSVVNAIEEEENDGGIIDSSLPNPNGIEFDNLYLDMNGIIHPCFHPEGQAAPKTYEQVFKAVFKYIDRIFSIVRPRKLLFLAIDGVAPRAKMNQQRTRRFKSAKEAADAAVGEERLREVFESEGQRLSALRSDSLDSNVITPGTEFMASLSSALQYYIHLRMNTDPGWRGIKVILSDANVVGEGEHKIMSYIRLQRNRRGFDPNTRHCMYGLDADLIMLALATHEIHFSILREDIRKAQQSVKDPQIKKSSLRIGRRERYKETKLREVSGEEANDYISRQQFQFLNVWVLRDYLTHDMQVPNSTVKLAVERLIDDFVFICLFVGNDFLPHVPSLEISEGAIDLLMNVYKKEFVLMGGYLTDSYKVNLKRVEHFVQAVSYHENAIFRKRRQVDMRFQGGSNAQRRTSEESRKLSHAKQNNSENFWSSINLSSESTELPSPSLGSDKSQGSGHNATPNGASTITDNIRLGEEGWKERFYTEKFEVKTEDERDKIRKHAFAFLKVPMLYWLFNACISSAFANTVTKVLKYIEGMCWVMHYYYEGVCSWQWFYPYHYAPFASDFLNIEHCEIHFTPGTPFKPFDQLMGVLPAASAHALPLCYRELMTDSSSPILDFYPTDFELDMFGKRHAWQAICKLPFIEESRLLLEIAKVEHTLADEEKRRNSFGMDLLFVHISHPLAAEIIIFFERNKDHPKLAKAKVKRRIDPKFSGGMNGFLYISDKPVWPLEVCSSINDMEKIAMNKVISVFYKYPTSHTHIPRPPEGVVMPRMSVRKEDIFPAPVLWHEKSVVLGRLHSERPVPNSISGSCLAKLAHRLVLEYYTEKMKENVDPAVLDGLFSVDALSNSKEPILEKRMDDSSCVNVVKPEKKESDAAGTKSGQRKRRCAAADQKRQENVDPVVLGHNSLDTPSCEALQVKVLERKVDNETCLNAGNSEKKESVAAGTKPSKRKQNQRAAGDKNQATVEPAVVAASLPIQSKNLNEMVHMDSERCVDAKESEKKESDTILGKREQIRRDSVVKKEKNVGLAVTDAHAAVDTPSLPLHQNSEEAVRRQTMDDVSHSRPTKPENKDDVAAGIVPGRVKRKLVVFGEKRNAVIDEHIAVDAPTCPSQLNPAEKTANEKESGAAGTKPHKRKCKATANDESIVHKKQKEIKCNVVGS
ncbi:hypothetical protein IFM89_033201 [Coptis chinensis]|uniref:5'-3' exoribonuclease n=1 Tax=Coptis chinensis TaxID=261450 RepID=A0A835J166_9MAGN|nr:hypothetical protein IFM89_033201 [Coptis chinensis]